MTPYGRISFHIIMILVELDQSKSVEIESIISHCVQLVRGWLNSVYFPFSFYRK